MIVHLSIGLIAFFINTLFLIRIIYLQNKELAELREKKGFKPPVVVKYEVQPVEICCSRMVGNRGYQASFDQEYVEHTHKELAYDIGKEIERIALIKGNPFIEVVDYSKLLGYSPGQPYEVKYIISLLPVLDQKKGLYS